MRSNHFPPPPSRRDAAAGHPARDGPSARTARTRRPEGEAARRATDRLHSSGRPAGRTARQARAREVAGPARRLFRSAAAHAAPQRAACAAGGPGGGGVGGGRPSGPQPRPARPPAWPRPVQSHGRRRAAQGAGRPGHAKPCLAMPSHAWPGMCTQRDGSRTPRRRQAGGCAWDHARDRHRRGSRRDRAEAGGLVRLGSCTRVPAAARIWPARARRPPSRT